MSRNGDELTDFEKRTGFSETSAKMLLAAGIVSKDEIDGIVPDAEIPDSLSQTSRLLLGLPPKPGKDNEGPDHHDPGQ